MPNVTANIAVFDTEIKDYQAQVTNGDIGVVRGYLANAEKVRVRGAEFDTNARVNRNFYVYGALAYTDAKYVSFPDAPPAIEDTGGPQFVDASGTVLPGISKWAVSIGGEWAAPWFVLQPRRRVLRRARCQLSIVVLVERDVLELPDHPQLLAGQRARRFPRGGRLDAVGLVAQPPEQGLSRADVGRSRATAGCTRRSRANRGRPASPCGSA